MKLSCTKVIQMRENRKLRKRKICYEKYENMSTKMYIFGRFWPKFHFGFPSSRLLHSTPKSVDDKIAGLPENSVAMAVAKENFGVKLPLKYAR
jgi:hypothetical protein